jgi:hypothetical protein
MNDETDLIPSSIREIGVPPFDELIKLVFGEPKSGKTTFCAGDPATLFIATEPAQDFVQTRSIFLGDELKERLEAGSQWECFQYLVRQLYMQRKNGSLEEKNIKSVTIDIVDSLYAHCLNYVCLKKQIDYPPENDFGKTWKEVREEWEVWMRRLMSIVDVTFISHCTSEKIMLLTDKGLKKEITRWQPTFKGNKAAQYLDGVICSMGHVRKDASGRYTISFKGDPSTAAGDRTGFLEELGEMPLNFDHVKKAYQELVLSKGFKLHSKWSR